MMTIIVGTQIHTSYELYLVIEGKRLPTPTKARQKEYVTGFENISGGIQRFKLGLHGAGLMHAAMIGYIQKGQPEVWFSTINGWISELDGTTCSPNCQWSSAERLSEFIEDLVNRVTKSVSRHARAIEGDTTEILIHHFWISM